MKCLLSLLPLLFVAVAAQAQCDTIYFHNGGKAAVQIIGVQEYAISFKYCQETAVYVYSKYAVGKIIFASGRTEMVSDKIEIRGEEDWQKVVVLEDKSQTAGLKRQADIAASTAFFNLHTANTGDRKAQELLLKEAARQHCPFVYLHFDRETNFTGFKTYGALQNKKRAFAFGY